MTPSLLRCSGPPAPSTCQGRGRPKLMARVTAGRAGPGSAACTPGKPLCPAGPAAQPGPARRVCRQHLPAAPAQVPPPPARKRGTCGRRSARARLGAPAAAGPEPAHRRDRGGRGREAQPLLTAQGRAGLS